MSVESHDLGPVPNLTALSGYGDSYVVPGDEVYVVSEDTDYIYLNTGSNPPADGFNIIKAIFLPGVWQRRSSGGGAGALRFNTVALGALGSGRLIDTSLAGLVDGTSLAWVESVKDTWRWDATSVLTADNITVCNPTANGANPGRFIRQLIPAPEWMTQLTWVIDPSGLSATPSDENSGAVGFPLATDAERQRRMGRNPLWSAGAYHLRYVSDIPAADPVNIVGTLFAGTNSMVFVHGNLTDGQGQSTTFGPAAVGTVTALTYSTNTPWSFICATIPVSWTASGAVEQRGRVTASGVPANVGGTFFPIKDLGGAAPNAAARLAEPSVAGTFTMPYTTPSTRATFTPTAGDTFVVEKLTNIFQLTIALDGTFNINLISVGVVIESVNPTVLTWNTRDYALSIDACIVSSMLSNEGYPGPVFVIGSRFATNAPPPISSWTFVNGYAKNAVNSMDIRCAVNGILTRFMAQGTAIKLTCQTPVKSNGLAGWIMNQIGICDMGASAALVVYSNAAFSAAATLWGPGNTAEPVRTSNGSSFGYFAAPSALPNSYFFISSGGGAWLSMEGRTSVPAFDQATSLFTAPRLLSATNLQTTIAAGGFGGQVNDAVTGCVFSQSTL